MKAAPRRRAWLTARKARGLARPLPVRVVVANGDAASGVSANHTRRIVRQCAARADLLLLSEVHNINVAAALGETWRVVQLGVPGSSLSGVAVAVRRSRGRFTERGSHTKPVGPTLRGRRATNLRARQWLPTQIAFDPGTPHRWRHRTTAGHVPPARAAFLWAAYRATAPSVGSLGADFNRLAATIRRWFPGRRVEMVDLLGLVIPRWIPSSEPTPIDVGGDHPAAAITLWP